VAQHVTGANVSSSYLGARPCLCVSRDPGHGRVQANGSWPVASQGQLRAQALICIKAGSAAPPSELGEPRRGRVRATRL
jgi:hypothetical protein